MHRRLRTIALYLPQYHPIPENDEWWGRGFTEWTNTAKAKPLFRGHYQPHVPADLGFYDLRLPEARAAQVNLAKEYGLDAFCYYHYWFAGRRILDRPFNDVLVSGEPDFPFCLCWANETWTGVWHGAPSRILIEQTYPGEEDHRAHFATLLPAFKDSRYVTVDGKPLFGIYRPFNIPNYKETIDCWQDMALKAGLRGLHIVSMQPPLPVCDYNCIDAFAVSKMPLLRSKTWVSSKNFIRRVINAYCDIIERPTVYLYEKVCQDLISYDISDAIVYPCLVPNWDNTPRSGKNGLVLHDSSPDLFALQVRKALKNVESLPENKKIIFIKSWNEWAEGNHLEPDIKYGRQYLDVLKKEIFSNRL
jgi:hypothetical protein